MARRQRENHKALRLARTADRRRRAEFRRRHGVDIDVAIAVIRSDEFAAWLRPAFEDLRRAVESVWEALKPTITAIGAWCARLADELHDAAQPDPHDHALASWADDGGHHAHHLI